MNPDPEYIKNIVKKLDSLNKAAGVDPDMKKNLVNIPDPDKENFMDLLGGTAMNYLNSKKNPK